MSAQQQIQVPSTMNAIRAERFGGPEVLALQTVAIPKSSDGEVVVKATYSGVNFADTHMVKNEYVLKQPLPITPGQEIVGVRADNGQRVVALWEGSGGYADFVSVPEQLCVPVPEGISDQQAVAALIQGLTAWHLLVSCGVLAAGSSRERSFELETAAARNRSKAVVVHSAAGGTGQLCVQLAKALGAGTVIGSVSSQSKVDLVKGLGADQVVLIDGRSSELEAEQVTAQLVAANDGRQVDQVIDMSGGVIFDGSLRALAPFGRIAVCGISTKQQNQIRSGHLLKNSRSVMGFWLFHALRGDLQSNLLEPLEAIFELVRVGLIDPQIGGVWPLAQAADAWQAMLSRGTTGKLLLTH